MEQLKPIYLKYKFIIWPVTAGLSSIVILAFVIIPQVLSYFSIRNDIFKLKKDIVDLQTKAQMLQQIDEEKTTQDLQIVLQVLPNDRDVPQAMQVLESFIKSRGLDFTSSSYIASGKSPNSFQFNITVSGSLFLIKRFLVELQELPQIFQIEAVTAQFKANEAVEAGIPITVFYDPTAMLPAAKLGSIPTLTEKEEATLERLKSMISTRESTSSGRSPDIDSVPLGKTDPFN